MWLLNKLLYLDNKKIYFYTKEIEYNLLFIIEQSN